MSADLAEKLTAKLFREAAYSIKHPVLARLPFTNFYGPCIGITLFKFGRRKVELFICPKGYEIPKHSHNDQDIELAFLYGQATFSRRVFCKSTVCGTYYYDESVNVEGLGNPFRLFTIKAGTVHWFAVSTKTLWFINFSKWKEGTKVTSATTDFHLA